MSIPKPTTTAAMANLKSQVGRGYRYPFLPRHHISLPPPAQAANRMMFRHQCAQPAAQGQGLAVPVAVARRLGPPVCLCPTLHIGVTQLGGIHAVPPGNRAVRRFQDSQRGHCAVTSTFLTPLRCREPTALAPGIRVSSNVVRSRGARPRAGRGLQHRYALGPHAYGSAPSSRGLFVGVRGKGRLGSMEYRQIVAIPLFIAGVVVFAGGFQGWWDWLGVAFWGPQVHSTAKAVMGLSPGSCLLANPVDNSGRLALPLNPSNGNRRHRPDFPNVYQPFPCGLTPLARNGQDRRG